MGRNDGNTPKKDGRTPVKQKPKSAGNGNNASGASGGAGDLGYSGRCATHAIALRRDHDGREFAAAPNSCCKSRRFAR